LAHYAHIINAHNEICKFNMRSKTDSPAVLLEELRLLLKSAQLPVQMEIAAAAGVHQSLVSRARNGRLRRVTSKVQALFEYATVTAGAEERASAAASAMEAEAVAQHVVVGVTGKKAAGGPEVRQGGRHADDPYSRQAKEGLDAYLAEGYDARLIVEQLAVLRRAQRVRRPGRIGSSTGAR
jgi:predicted XRE-type DNA-binding protein